MAGGRKAYAFACWTFVSAKCGEYYLYEVGKSERVYM